MRFYVRHLRVHHTTHPAYSGEAARLLPEESFSLITTIGSVCSTGVLAAGRIMKSVVVNRIANDMNVLHLSHIKSVKERFLSNIYFESILK